MMQIPTSNNRYNIEITKMRALVERFEKIDLEKKIPIILSKICPADILAANRKERVSGRTRILTVSTRIKNGFNHHGPPSGRK